ncbi:hypothetical protein GLOTRDRAFT_133729 [Gloeophyllum trabeum ATCC 11539]|uniref:DUF6532 domain-containing protein n=1 Tax=Gloeophyllum trabeum (strain ATCC 11539 / FP-39264 / Madison 617) TaxID=670483 RepID=S7PT86_GLOTA|nr:uncharacterized protein GLOTRDRAFT_133729 [Gloeophyllum trabeum ATCC 11539]EPQ50618.1 hypothetical protein GLOTRDRAFT_133729 [Gloeophyllum trabeum ATCC 11539]
MVVAVWIQARQSSQTQGRKRAGSLMAPTDANQTKKTKKVGNAAEKPPTAPATKTRPYKPAVIESDSAESEAPSDADDVEGDEDIEDHEANAVESDDERLMRLPAGSLAAALESEAPLFHGAEYPSDDDYDPVLHAPPKMHRKSSASSFNSSIVSVPDVDDPNDEVPSAMTHHPSVHSLGSGGHAGQTLDYKSVKPAKLKHIPKAPNAIDLFNTDDHVTDRAGGKSKPQPRKDLEKNPELSSQTAFTYRGKPAKKLKSKYERAHEAEAPVWDEPSDLDIEHDVEQRKSSSKKSVIRAQRAQDYHTDSDESDSARVMTALTFNSRGKLNLTAQTVEIQAIARGGIDRIHIQIITEHSYPDIGKRNQVALKACIRAAEDLGPHYKPILVRLRDETQVVFRKAVADIADGRISGIRRDVKGIASGHCVGHYGLKQDSKTYIENLLDAQRYVFAGDHKSTPSRVNYKLPWRQDAVVAIMRQAFFTGKNNFALTHPSLFVSSFKDREDEREVPEGMVALVCTAIHACIDEWRTGTHVPEDFSSNNWAETYDIHKSMLRSVRESGPRFYHETMHYLYDQAMTSTRNGIAIDAQQPNALSLMDLSGLD